MSNAPLFETTRIGDTIVIEPTRNMGEFEMAEIDASQESAYQRLIDLAGHHHVVMDLGQTDYFGSSTIGLFNRFVSHVKSGERKIAFCNLSKHETEIIDITRVNQIWAVKQTRDEALAYVAAED